MASYGIDCSTYTGAVPDLDGSFGLLSGVQVVAEAVARRLSTPRGGLWYDANYGFDLRSLLNLAIPVSQYGLYAGVIEAEALKDERVQSATASLTYNFQTSSLRVVLLMQTSAGPFALTLAVTSLTVTLISAK